MILSIGDLLLDITIVPDGPLRPDDDRVASIALGGGGQAANFCAWTAALGEPVRLITRVGDDERGRRLVSDLEARGVEVCAVWAAEPRVKSSACHCGRPSGSAQWQSRSWPRMAMAESDRVTGRDAASGCRAWRLVVVRCKYRHCAHTGRLWRGSFGPCGVRGDR